jgi:hypothetical protein
MLADDEGQDPEDEMQGDMGADLHAGAVAGGALDAPCPLAGARASRELITQRAGQYPASKAIDGTSETAWAVTDAIAGEDWIEVSLTAPMTVTRVAFTPGWDRISPRGLDLFVANARVRRATIVTDAGRRTVDAAADERMKEVRLDHQTTRVRLVIEEVWPGERWQDLSVGEITPYCAR